MSESIKYKGHWPPRPVKNVKGDQVVQLLEPKTGRILTGTVIVPPLRPGGAVLVQLDDDTYDTYIWAWERELSEKENNERTS